MRLRQAAACIGVAAAMLVVATPASADHLQSAMNVGVGSPAQLVNGVSLEVPVAITCPADFPGPYTLVSVETVEVSVTQNVGRAFAQGYGGYAYQSGFPYGIPLGTPLPCDGGAHTLKVTVLPDTAGRPFHGGRAVASASLAIALVDPLSPWLQDSNFVTTGVQPISIHG